MVYVTTTKAPNPLPKKRKSRVGSGDEEEEPSDDDATDKMIKLSKKDPNF